MSPCSAGAQTQILKDPYHFGKLNPDPDPHHFGNFIRIRIKVQSQICLKVQCRTRILIKGKS